LGSRGDDPDDPHLAVFTAVVHPQGRSAVRAARAALATLHKVDVATARDHPTVILACATPAVRRALEATLLDLNLPPAPILAVLEERQRASAREEGLEEGAQVGRRTGYVHVLRTQLRRRFGSVPEWVEDRLTAAALTPPAKVPPSAAGAVKRTTAIVGVLRRSAPPRSLGPTHLRPAPPRAFIALATTGPAAESPPLRRRADRGSAAA
jgi:hypothetical protein